MELRLTNGSTVNRIYGDTPDGELLAGFQYEGDAIAFAKTKLAEDAARQAFDSRYVVSNHWNGKVFIFQHQKEQKKAAA